MGRYVFPDGDLTALDATLRCAEAAGFEVRDVENLREHYVRTLRAWSANLAANRDAAIDATDARTERIWRLVHDGQRARIPPGTSRAGPDAIGETAQRRNQRRTADAPRPVPCRGYGAVRFS